MTITAASETRGSRGACTVQIHIVCIVSADMIETGWGINDVMSLCAVLRIIPVWRTTSCHSITTPRTTARPRNMWMTWVQYFTGVIYIYRGVIMVCNRCSQVSSRGAKTRAGQKRRDAVWHVCLDPPPVLILFDTGLLIT